jgi:hypothetical protein
VTTTAALSPGSLRAQAPSASAATAEPRVEAAGQGESRVPPDRATVTLQVVNKGASAARVAATNARVQQQVLDTLRAMGFSGPLVSTVSYNVSPNEEELPNGRGSRQVGYVARNAVRVQLRQLDRVGAVIDAALARGATGVEDVEFAASNTDSAEAAALAQAAQRARVNADAIARSLGGRLGALIEVASPQRGGGGEYMLASMRVYAPRAGGFALSSDTPISPTDIVVQAAVVGRWRFDRDASAPR